VVTVRRHAGHTVRHWALLVDDTGRRAARVRVVDDTRPGRDREWPLPQTRKGYRAHRQDPVVGSNRWTFWGSNRWTFWGSNRWTIRGRIRTAFSLFRGHP
jgi:hypothetical protein